MPSPLSTQGSPLYKIIQGPDAQNFWTSSPLSWVIWGSAIALIIGGISINWNDQPGTLQKIGNVFMFGVAGFLLLGYYFTSKSDIIIAADVSTVAGGLSSAVASGVSAVASAASDAVQNMDKFTGT